jgi:hypothetical protein
MIDLHAFSLCSVMHFIFLGRINQLAIYSRVQSTDTVFAYTRGGRIYSFASLFFTSAVPYCPELQLWLHLLWSSDGCIFYGAQMVQVSQCNFVGLEHVIHRL